MIDPAFRHGVDGASVVMPTYNRRNTILAPIDAALADPATRELIVVVDGSTDGTYELLSELATRDPRVRPIWQENSGEAQARQRGVEAAAQPVVVLLDDDVVVDRGVISGHVTSHGNGGRRVVVGYMRVQSPRRWPEATVAEIYATAYERRCRRYEADPREILRSLWAGNLSLRRDQALEVGLVSPGRRYEYHGDRDLGLRLMKAGFTSTFDRGLGATHSYTRSLEGFRRDAVRSGRDQWLLHELHGDVLGAFSVEPWIAGMPASARALVRFTRRPRASVAIGAMSALVSALGPIAPRRTTIRAMTLLSLMLRQRAALEARRSWRQVPG